MANLLNSLTDKIPGALGTHANYGEQVDLDGTKIIPVSYVAFGFGAGEDTGSGSAAKQAGSGGGGGGVSIPIGAYVSRGSGAAQFEPNIIALLVVGIPFVCVAGKALARIVRALKR